jgi:hypothetical protein
MSHQFKPRGHGTSKDRSVGQERTDPRLLVGRTACRLSLTEGHQHPAAETLDDEVDMGLAIQVAGDPLLEKTGAESSAGWLCR